MHEMLTLGIDFGTSAVKAVVTDDDGSVIAHASAPYPLHKPFADRAEQDPEDWWTALLDVCRQILSQVPAGRIAALGLSGQLNGIVLLDGEGLVLRPALIWLDQRCGRELAELESAFAARLSEWTGSPASPIAILPKLRWLMRHEPELMGRVRHVAQVKDYILWRLTGEWVTEANEASATLMMDLGRRAWSDELLAYAGIRPEWLPPIVASDRFAGKVGRDAARLTGLPEGLPVAPGAGDTGALAVGCGAYEPGVAAVTLGTAGHVVAAVPNTAPGLVPGLWRMAHVSADRELWLGLIPAGGLSIAWLRQLASGPSEAELSFEAVEALARQAPPGSDGVVFLPFLEGAGTPWNRPWLRAGFSGLNVTHGMPAMARAVYEGIAFNIRACVEAFETSGVRITRIHLAEGGARSAFWCQIIADVLNREVHVVEQGDTSATGAAILARAALTGVPLASLVARGVALGRCFVPDPALGAVHEAAWQRFCAVASQAMTGGPTDSV